MMYISKNIMDFKNVQEFLEYFIEVDGLYEKHNDNKTIFYNNGYNSDFNENSSVYVKYIKSETLGKTKIISSNIQKGLYYNTLSDQYYNISENGIINLYNLKSIKWFVSGVDVHYHNCDFSSLVYKPEMFHKCIIRTDCIDIENEKSCCNLNEGVVVVVDDNYLTLEGFDKGISG